ncbi:hypothetical protein AVEN_78700-1 [Araneus ventricosus]|uniref:Uncharacterized protein n=1 Tax=Araneus ventricosus TaxID=182803 RepID=A0A4Y2JCP3_ARAVE|nr:hypothetical protein AVEN_78700-1 [Araneus ventricosus]
MITTENFRLISLRRSPFAIKLERDGNKHTTQDTEELQTASQIKSDGKSEIDQESWKEWLMNLNEEDNSIYIAARKFSRKYIQIPPILDTDYIKCTPLGKANAFKYSLENSFQTSPEPYDDLPVTYLAIFLSE